MKHLLLSFVFLASVPAAGAATPDASSFADKVVVANKYEIETARLALEYGKNPKVKSFAQTMVDEHTKAGEDFKSALRRAGIQLPRDVLDDHHTAQYEKLRSWTTRGDFDAAYIKDGVAAHEQTVAAFKDFAVNGAESPVKDFAKETLPTLEHHLKMVKDLEAKVAQPPSQ